MNALQITQTADSNVGLTSLSGFELAQRAGKMLAASTLVPKEYQGPSGIPNCVIALNMAHRMGADPLMIMQNLVVVHGRPTWSAQFLIATFNSCGRFTAMRFEFFGDKGTDDYGCRAHATEKSTGEKLVGTDVTIGIAKAEGWHGRNGSKWKTMPQQMLTYRAASWFVRAIAPELSMGLHTNDEVIDISDYHEINEKTVSSVDDLLLADAPPKVVAEPVILEAEKKTRTRAPKKPIDEPAVAEIIEVEEPVFVPSAEWEIRIKECGDQDALMSVLAEMSDADEAEMSDIIDAQFDMFRSLPVTSDPLAELRVQIKNCADIPSISALYRTLSVDVKGLVADDVRSRQDTIKAEATARVNAGIVHA